MDSTSITQKGSPKSSPASVPSPQSHLERQSQAQQELSPPTPSFQRPGRVGLEHAQSNEAQQAASSSSSSPLSPFAILNRRLAATPRHSRSTGQRYVRHRNDLPSMRQYQSPGQQQQQQQQQQQSPSHDRFGPSSPAPLRQPLSSPVDESASPSTVLRQVNALERSSPRSPIGPSMSTSERNPFIRSNASSRRQNPVSSPPQVQLPFEWRAATPTFSTLFRSPSRADEAPAKAIDAELREQGSPPVRWSQRPLLDRDEDETEEESSGTSDSAPASPLRPAVSRQRDSAALRALEGLYVAPPLSAQEAATLHPSLQRVHRRHIQGISPVFAGRSEPLEMPASSPVVGSSSSSSGSPEQLPWYAMGFSQEEGEPAPAVAVGGGGGVRDDVARGPPQPFSDRPLDLTIHRRMLYVFHPGLGSFVPTDRRANVWFPEAESRGEARAIVVDETNVQAQGRQREEEEEETEMETVEDGDVWWREANVRPAMGSRVAALGGSPGPTLTSFPSIEEGGSSGGIRRAREEEEDDASILAFLNGPEPPRAAAAAFLGLEEAPSRPTTPWPGLERADSPLSVFREPSPGTPGEPGLGEYPRPMSVAGEPRPATASAAADAGKRSVSRRVGRTVIRAFGGLRRRKENDRANRVAVWREEVAEHAGAQSPNFF